MIDIEDSRTWTRWAALGALDTLGAHAKSLKLKDLDTLDTLDTFSRVNSPRRKTTPKSLLIDSYLLTSKKVSKVSNLSKVNNINSLRRARWRTPFGNPPKPGEGRRLIDQEPLGRVKSGFGRHWHAR